MQDYLLSYLHFLHSIELAQASKSDQIGARLLSEAKRSNLSTLFEGGVLRGALRREQKHLDLPKSPALYLRHSQLARLSIADHHGDDELA